MEGLTVWALQACSSCSPEAAAVLKQQKAQQLGFDRVGNGRSWCHVLRMVWWRHSRNQHPCLPQLASGGLQQRLAQRVAPLPALAALKPPSSHQYALLHAARCQCWHPRAVWMLRDRHRMQMHPFCRGANVPVFCRRPARLSRHEPSWQQMQLVGTPSSRLLHVKAGLQLSARSAHIQHELMFKALLGCCSSGLQMRTRAQRQGQPPCIAVTGTDMQMPWPSTTHHFSN